MHVRRIESADRSWVAEVVSGAFASADVVSRGRLTDDAAALDGFAIESDGRPIGCALWRVEDGDCELVVIVTTYRGVGAGTALLDAVVAEGHAEGWRRLWLITTNDNTDAIRLYQRAGWDWVAWHRDAVEQNRSLKPELPPTGAHGIAIRHEIEFEYPLA